MDPAAWDTFREYAASTDRGLTDAQGPALERGARWLAQASKASGLSQYTRPEDALLRAMGPALAYFRAATPRVGRVVDVGCGNGAIGATIAFFAPYLEVYLVDRAKRAYTTSELLVAKLGLTNAHPVHGTAGTLTVAYDAAVFRALAPAKDALPLAASVIRPGGCICAFHRRGDVGFEQPEPPYEALETHETLVPELLMTCYRS